MGGAGRGAAGDDDGTPPRRGEARNAAQPQPGKGQLLN